MAAEGYTIEEAAGILGVSEKTVRRRIKAGKLTAEKVPVGETGDNFKYVVKLSGTESPASVQSAIVSPTVQTLLGMLQAKDGQINKLQEEISQLQEERANLAGHLGTFRERVRLLEAPKEEGQPWWRRLFGTRVFPQSNE